MLSIVIPTYNEEDNLTRLLPKLQKELSSNDEIIVVDARESMDGAQGVCERNSTKYIKSNASCRAHQLNEGAQAADKTKLFFLHADVIPPQGFYQLIDGCVQKPEDVGCFAYNLDSSSWLLKVNSFFTQFQGVFTGGGDQGLFLYKSTFDELGGYNNDLKIMEDFDLYDRVKKAGYHFSILKPPSMVSARKYEQNSYFMVNIIQGIVFVKYRLGHSQESIKGFYEHWLV